MKSSLGTLHLTLFNFGIANHLERDGWLEAPTIISAIAISIVTVVAFVKVVRLGRRRELGGATLSSYTTVLAVSVTFTTTLLGLSVMELYPFRGRLIFASRQGRNVLLTGSPTRLATAAGGR